MVEEAGLQIKSADVQDELGRHLVCTCMAIDPMHKWRQFKYSFVYIQISPTGLILGNIFFWKSKVKTQEQGSLCYFQCKQKIIQIAAIYA